MPGVCLCHKEIDRFPSSSTAPKSEILGCEVFDFEKEHWRISYFASAKAEMLIKANFFFALRLND